MSDKKHALHKSRRAACGNYLWMLFLVCVFIGSALYLFRYFDEIRKSEEKVYNLKELVSEEMPQNPKVSQMTATSLQKAEYVEVDGVRIQKKYEEIYKKNPDFIGWLKIPGTDIDYPVMQTVADEDYYIDKDFDQEYSRAGMLFADASSDVKTPSDNILIYGHNMKSGNMFHDLLLYEEEDFFLSHKTIVFDTIYGDGVYEVIAAFRTRLGPDGMAEVPYDIFFKAENAQEYNQYVQMCKDSSIKTKLVLCKK